MSELNRRNRYTYASDCSLKKEQATYRIIKFPLMEFGHVHLDLPAMGRSIVLLRTDYKLPGEGDTLAASILCEALGRGTPPAIVVPCLKMDLVRHPAFSRSIALLRECSVRILH